jgi:hypothetical protein
LLSGFIVRTVGVWSRHFWRSRRPLGHDYKLYV